MMGGVIDGVPGLVLSRRELGVVVVVVGGSGCNL